jgi:isopenicillin N synthase-like dioxygenase
VTLPIIDVTALRDGSAGADAVADALGRACREHGFFYVAGHGLDPALEAALEAVSRRFFALPLASKQAIRMELGGRAWRGYFPVGGELTSGKPDLKEGLYLGTELGPDHPLVHARTPMHGPNLWPAELPELRPVVLAWMAAMERLGHQLMTGLARSLGLAGDHFAARYMADPLILFRIFNYPPPISGYDAPWGVGEHTDYGVLTILKQDDAGGLEVKSQGRWLAAPPVPGTFVCNIGDMLERLTKGLFRSTPHRVRNVTGRDRLSWPFFFDPDFAAEIGPLDLSHAPPPDADARDRWDHASVHDVSGTYGEYLLGKVARVFPQLREAVL